MYKMYIKPFFMLQDLFIFLVIIIRYNNVTYFKIGIIRLSKQSPLIMKLKFSCVLFFFFFCINTACCCLCYTLYDFEEQIERSDLIFIGTVDTIFENYYETNSSVYLIRIQKQYKSKSSKYFTSDAVYITNTSSCAKHFCKDSTYLVYARDIGYFNTVHMCSRTNLLSNSTAKKDLALLWREFEPTVPQIKITKNIFRQIEDKTKADSLNKDLQVLLDQSAQENSILSRNNKISYSLILLLLVLGLFLFFRSNAKY